MKKNFFCNKAPSWHALVILFRDCNYNLLSLSNKRAKPQKLQINGNNRQKTVFIVFFSFYDEASWKEYSLLVFYLVSFSRSLFWFSFCLFQSTNKLEFLQSLFSWCLSNNPFWFLVRKQLKSNKHLQKGGKWYFLFGLQIWPIYVRRKTLLSIIYLIDKFRWLLTLGRCTAIFIYFIMIAMHCKQNFMQRKIDVNSVERFPNSMQFVFA